MSWKGKFMDGWMDGWMNGWMDGWMDVVVCGFDWKWEIVRRGERVCLGNGGWMK